MTYLLAYIAGFLTPFALAALIGWLARSKFARIWADAMTGLRW